MNRSGVYFRITGRRRNLNVAAGKRAANRSQECSILNSVSVSFLLDMDNNRSEAGGYLGGCNPPDRFTSVFGELEIRNR